jgi:hypothetical protein
MPEGEQSAGGRVTLAGGLFAAAKIGYVSDRGQS